MINHLPYGSDNKDLKKTGSFPNSPTATSPNPNIKLNRGICSHALK